MPLPMRDDASPNPIDIGALRSATVMFRADYISNTIEQFRRTIATNFTLKSAKSRTSRVRACRSTYLEVSWNNKDRPLRLASGS
jgi:hypothetical protein